MSDHVDAPPELMPPEACDCCGVPVFHRRSSVWHSPRMICGPCFYIWYDDGLTNMADIKRVRLERYGTEDTQEVR
jgi:hypothetical protein